MRANKTNQRAPPHLSTQRAAQKSGQRYHTRLRLTLGPETGKKRRIMLAKSKDCSIPRDGRQMRHSGKKMFKLRPSVDVTAGVVKLRKAAEFSFLSSECATCFFSLLSQSQH